MTEATEQAEAATTRLAEAQEALAAAKADLEAQVTPDGDGVEALQKRYPGAQARNFDAQDGPPTEMDALIAYMQMLGTLVDFSTFTPDASR